MLRITTFKEEKMVRFEVEGRLTAECISVLENCWQEVKDLPLQVEFTDITFVDGQGKRLLKKMTDAGVKLYARDIHLKAILENMNKEEVEL